MKANNLSPYIPPPPAEKPTCASCKAFSPDCLVPVGDGAVQMCWVCAHHVVDHEVSVRRACEARCACSRDKIYPQSVLETREALSRAVHAAHAKPAKRM